MGIADLDKTAFERLYGPWAPRAPTDVALLLEDFPALWWVAGGWAIEAFTGVRREHEDIDPCILLTDLTLLRRHLAARYDVWSAGSGALRPLLPDDDAAFPEDAHQVWLRRSAYDPWEYDVLLAPGTPEVWVYRRDPSLTMPMPEALWERDGIRYLRPEIQLLYKAPGLRAKDRADFDAALPLLDHGRRAWLHDALVRTAPDHPWIARLG